MDYFLWNCPVYSERCAFFLEQLKKDGKEFEHFKSCNNAGKSCYIQELLRIVKSCIIDTIM